MKKNIVLLLVFYFNTFTDCHAAYDNIKDAVILQHLAQTQHSLMNANYRNAYENSKMALCLLEQDGQPELDFLYIVSFEHVIACDQAGYYDQRDDALYLLKSLTEAMECNGGDFGFESVEGYNDLVALASLCPSQETQHELEDIAASLFFNDTCHIKLQKDKSYQCKKFWKRSFSWWKKQVTRLLKEIKDWLEIAKEVKELYDEHLKKQKMVKQ